MTQSDNHTAELIGWTLHYDVEREKITHEARCYAAEVFSGGELIRSLVTRQTGHSFTSVQGRPTP